jgi:DNA processing protein
MSSVPTRVLTPNDADFPLPVRAMTKPPDRLYVRGVLPRQPSVAVVGTRAATMQAMAFAREMAGTLADAGVAVWSGGALGIDGAAHEGALAVGGATVVVMGTGFAETYPAAHRELFDRVLEEGGAWLSLFDHEQRGARWTFLARNELMACMVDAVVLVQAPLRSGARSTVAAARRMNKPVWVVPASPWDALGQGCVAELHLGGRVCDGPDRILAALGRPVRRRRTTRSGAGAGASGEQAEPVERQVLEALGQGRAHPDEICQRTGLPPGLVQGALLTLTLRHVLVEGSDGSFQRVTC